MLTYSILSSSVLLFLISLSESFFVQELHGDRGSLSCGVLLALVTSKCGSVRYSSPKRCCEAIRAWNDGQCWCDSNAFTAASNVAMDNFAFQFRVDSCNITSPFRPELLLPVASRKKIPSTCPGDVLLKEKKHTSAPCSNLRDESLLRDQRLSVIESLSNLDVYREADVLKWSSELDSIFIPEAILFSVGMSFSFPRVNIKKVLLSRSTLFGRALWKSSIDFKSLLWRSPNSVSYVSGSSYGPFGYSRVEFVSFEKCSSRISHLIVQEEEAVRLLRQFVHFDPSDRILWRLRRNAVSWCRKVGKICGASFSPFLNIHTCLKAYKRLQYAQVTCASQGSVSSTISLHGNTLACRDLYLTLAERSPGKYCPFLGIPGIGRCRQQGCLKSWYDDVFSTKNPRFDHSASFKCSSTNCEEEWAIK